MDGKFVSYLRVSPDKQGQSGLGIEAQRAAVTAYLNGGSWELIAEYVEVESGKDSARPQLAKALTHCRLTGATLVVAKLDRLSRNVAFLAQLMDGNVEFVACDNPHATRFTLHILAAVAEHEAAAISARTKGALGAVKARGKTLGGWRTHRRDGSPNTYQVDGRLGAAAVHEATQRFAREVGPMVKEMRANGSSLRQIASELAARGIRTPRGGAWTAAAVRNILGCA